MNLLILLLTDLAIGTASVLGEYVYMYNVM